MENYKVSGNIVDKQIMDELVLLDLQTGDYHSLNETAAFIWNKAGSDASMQDIAKALEEAFSVDFNHAIEDVENTFQQLRGLGFIE